ncbi:MAG: polyribonucleotide nucleotidyltransferase, partial [Epsilonproteobacteria bacterium]
MKEQILEVDINGLEEKYEFNKIAKQASGAVMYRQGKAVLISAVAIDEKAVDEDFLPLTVQYMEKSYASAKIPGGVIKRETKPGDFETLTSRIVDRSLRPLFPEGFHYPVTISVMVVSADKEVDMQVAALHAANAALYVSDIPVTKSIAAVRVGTVGDDIVINPTLVEQRDSELDLL